MFTNLFIAKLIIYAVLGVIIWGLFLRLYKHLTNFFKDLINFLKRPSRIKKSRNIYVSDYVSGIFNYKRFYPTPLHKRVDVLQRNKDFTFLRGKTRPGFLSNEDISNPIYFTTGSILFSGATLTMTDTTGPSNEPHYVLGQPSVHYSIPIR